MPRVWFFVSCYPWPDMVAVGTYQSGVHTDFTPSLVNVFERVREACFNLGVRRYSAHAFLQELLQRDADPNHLVGEFDTSVSEGFIFGSLGGESLGGIACGLDRRRMSSGH